MLGFNIVVNHEAPPVAHSPPARYWKREASFWRGVASTLAWIVVLGGIAFAILVKQQGAY